MALFSGSTDHSSESDLNRLARGLFEEEGRMLPEIDRSGWDDQSNGRIVCFENAVKAVLREATILRIIS